MQNIYGVTQKELENYLISIGEKESKAPLIFKAVYGENLIDFFALPFRRDLCEKLTEDFSLSLPRLEKQTNDDAVCKMLFCLKDNAYIESVLMQQTYGNSVCVSTQVGCNMGCAFCQSGKHKKERNLTAAEMVSQLMFFKRNLKKEISTVTIMGIGEPLDNYDEVMKFIDIIANPHSFNIGMRHITLSTCGLVPQILAYSKRKPTNSLAISLHAPTDEIRNRLMPINKVYPLSELIAALQAYTTKVKRKVLLEYIMLSHVNDEIEHAKALSLLLKGLPCKVNLIPYNETNSLQFERSSFARIMAFYDVLKHNGISVTIRREFGGKVKAACGQLQAEMNQN